MIAAIGALIVCRACKGTGLVDGSDCARCVVDGLPTGVDPEARCSCVEEHKHGDTVE